ncbi:MAG TPA: PaaI family thioesterase [Pseudomonadales bacterium]|nr:PaaI family thioesterase [Pseudomonadales bacterium]
MSTHEKPFSTPAPMPPYNTVWAVRRRIAQQLRDLNALLLTHDVPLDELLAMEQTLAGQLPVANHGAAIHGRLEWAALSADHGTYHLLSRETTPIAGHGNAMSPPLHMWLDHDKGEAHATITLGWAYEGPPKCVHGGWVAALFDEFLGCAQLLSGQTGATGNLDVRYKRPTPLDTELTLFATVKEVHGRKIVMEGTLSANGLVTASCEGLFVSFAEGVMNLADRKLTTD